MEHLLNIHTEEIQKDGKDTYYNHRYEPTPYEILEEFFDSHPLKKEDHLVDYGCGPGRVLFYLNHRFHCKGTGIEYNEEYYRKSLENRKSYKGIHKEKLAFHHCAAQDYSVTPDQNIFYFFNPFSIEIFMQTLGQIQDSLFEFPRPIKIIMYYPDSEYLYYLNNCTEFIQSEVCPVHALHRKDEREAFVIFTSNN